MARLRRLGLKPGGLTDDEALELVIAPRPAITDAHIDRYQRWAIARHGSDAGGRLASQFRSIIEHWRARRQADEQFQKSERN